MRYIYSTFFILITQLNIQEKEVEGKLKIRISQVPKAVDTFGKCRPTVV